MPRQYTKNDNTKTAKIIALAKDGVPSQEIAKVVDISPDSVHSILSRWRRRQRADGKEVVFTSRSRHASLWRAKAFPEVIAELEAGDTLAEVADRHDLSMPCVAAWMRRHSQGYTVNDAGEFVPPADAAPSYESYGNPDVAALSVLLNIPKQEVVKRAVALYKENLVKSLTNTN
jgi:transposase-like protein